MHDDWLSVARQLAQLDRRRPRQAALRRAVSTAYYALFHALSHACVSETIGWQRRRDFWGTISPIYRGIDHGSARRLFSTILSNCEAPADLQRLAELFIDLQDARLRADYDPATRFIQDSAMEYVNGAEEAVRLLEALDSETRVQLVVQLLTKSRKTSS